MKPIPDTCILSNDQQRVSSLVPPLFYNVSKHFLRMVMVSNASFKSSSKQHDVHFVNDGPIKIEIDDNSTVCSLPSPPPHRCSKYGYVASKNQDGAGQCETSGLKTAVCVMVSSQCSILSLVNL